MKTRPAIREKTDAEAPFRALAEALSGLGSAAEVQAFLRDLCTPAEIEALSDRWRVVPMLLQGISYREIHDRTGVSVTTVGRVARTIEHGAGGYAVAIGLQFPHLAPSH